MSFKSTFYFLILSIIFISCKSTQPAPEMPAEEIETRDTIAAPKPEVPSEVKEEVAGITPWNPKTPRNIEEFRAAWVATVANINWPSKPGLSTSEQQREALELLDFLEEHNFNAVIFQVRPQADALYKSDIEPWSYYLTGEQGKAPDPYYDPLQFWVNAAHELGLEIHVWLNPYLANNTAGKEISEKSVIKVRVRVQTWEGKGRKNVGRVAFC